MAVKEKPLRVLAIDTSSSPGFALYEVKNGEPKLIAVDSVKTDTDYTDSERYAIVEAKTIQVIHAWGPFDHVCREHFTKGGSKRGTQLVFGAWAAVDTALGKFGYHVPSQSGTKFEVTNSRVKSLVGAHGSAKKKAVEDGIRVILNLPDTFIFRNDDESDAAAIGYTFLYDKGLINKGEVTNVETKRKSRRIAGAIPTVFARRGSDYACGNQQR